ncbi:MAG TPA: TlpA disulfide reductase family protein [Acidimicrobiales bacterium]|nr:TlpA disulfide reductase family protein [Acidimicrobiales bacterium]
MTSTIDARPEPAEPSGAPDRRRPRVAPWVALGLAVVLVGFVALLYTRKGADSTVAPSPLIGKPAPEVTGPGLDGSTVRLSAYQGRYVLLNFFASWCVPCRNEHDDLLKFTARHQAAGDAQVLAVIFDDDPATVRTWFQKNGGTWPVIEDPNGKVSLDFGVRGPPESFLIAPDGTVLTRIIGEVDANVLESLVAQAKKLGAGS